MRLYFATSNKKKVEEMSDFLKRHNIKLELEFYDKDIVEVAIDSLEEIAKDKARQALEDINRTVIAEDTGLFIHSLNGFPAPFSKWTCKKIGLEGFLALLKGKPREATFKTVIALASPGKETKIFVGEIDGAISEEIRGLQGWGYDPIFIPRGSTQTWGENYEEKLKDNHRARAMAKLVEYIQSQSL